MAVKKKDKKKKAGKKKKAEKKEPKLSRKSFILDTIRGAGKKGIAIKDLVAATDDQFEYGEGKSSRMRINNTLKEAKEEGTVKVTDGVAVWKG